MEANSALSYPIGQFIQSESYSAAELKALTQELSAMPSKLINLVVGWEENRFDTPYRPNGWTVRQVIHHLADSHMNAYIRFRLALTEDNPIVKPYDQDAWALLSDAEKGPVELSLQLLKFLHYRWILLINSCDEEMVNRLFYHPELNESVSLSTSIAKYAWHGEHHYQQIHQLAKRKGWI